MDQDLFSTGTGGSSTLDGADHSPGFDLFSDFSEQDLILPDVPGVSEGTSHHPAALGGSNLDGLFGDDGAAAVDFTVKPIAPKSVPLPAETSPVSPRS